MFHRLTLALLLSCFCEAALAGTQTAAAVWHYQLEVSFDIPQARIMGVAKIQGPPGRPLTLHFGDLKVKSIRGFKEKIDLTRLPDSLKAVPSRDGVEIVYEGRFTDPEENVIEAGEIILRSIWYPLVEGLSRYQLTARLPREYLALSEANHIHRIEKDGQAVYTFDLPFPLNDLDGLTFAASNRYRVARGTYRDIDLSAHLFPEDAHLAPLFLEQARRYLELFEARLGSYPYRRLAIVESSHPGAFSMPTYVLLCQREIQDIPQAGVERTSLGHEILHQWFGNSVFTCHDRGNWNEGATIYFADHFACEQRGTDWRCRRRILSGFLSHVTPGNYFPLRLFSERTDYSSRSIGYGKGAMVFHMLRRLVGDRAFFAAIRDFVREHTFRVASWDDLRTAMEKRSGRPLGWFFRQWLDTTGLPVLRLEEVKVKPVGQKFEVSLTLAQIGTTFRLLVPLTFHSPGGAHKRWVTLTRARERFTFTFDARPEEVVLDEDVDVFRRLDPRENPPVLERLLTGKIIAFLPPHGAEPYRRILDFLQREGISVAGRNSQELSAADADASVLLCGRDHPLAPKLLGNLALPETGLSLAVRQDPRELARLVAVLHCAPGEPVEAALREMLAYPFYSDYRFRQGQRLERTLEEPQRGIRVKLTDPRGGKT
ncbi:MAG: M1 family aminopeptidase [Desulfobaccales bacterium]